MSKKYENLYEQLLSEIKYDLENNIKKLPPERILAEKYHVSRQTVRNALEILEKEGCVHRVQGSGCGITGQLPKSGRNTIGLLLECKGLYTGPIKASLFRTLLQKSDLQLKVFSSDLRVSGERSALLEILEDSSILALIAEPVLSNIDSPNSELYEKIAAKGIPVIFMGGFYRNLQSFPFVKGDDFQGGRLLTKELLKKGHSRLGAIFNANSGQGQGRYLGMCRTLAEAGLELPDDNILWYTSRQLWELRDKNNTDFLIKYIRSNMSSVTALICQDDSIASALAQELKYARLHIPSDISILSFDNSYLAEYSGAALSSLGYPPEGDPVHVTLQLLFRLLQGQPAASRLLSWQLYDRHSIASLG